MVPNDTSQRASGDRHVPANDDHGQQKWLTGIRVYLGVSALAHLVWEMLQLPLYTLWHSGTGREIAFAVLHCTAGDALIAALTLLAALLVLGAPAWPIASFGRVAAATVLLGVVYTVWSEYLNTGIRSSWHYSELMPLVPPFGTGLAPLAQWLVIPMLALGLARSSAARPSGHRHAPRRHLSK